MHLLERLSTIASDDPGQAAASAEQIAAGRVKSVTPSRRYTPSKGWHARPRYGTTGVRLLQILGPATAAWLLVSSDVDEGGREKGTFYFMVESRVVKILRRRSSRVGIRGWR